MPSATGHLEGMFFGVFDWAPLVMLIECEASCNSAMLLGLSFVKALGGILLFGVTNACFSFGGKPVSWLKR
ncbi:hypothetical protein U1Q18_001513 [Sarracenia purpurea var. burkii]